MTTENPAPPLSVPDSAPTAPTAGTAAAVDRVESDYYAFMEFDADNARSVLSHYVSYFPSGPVLELASGPGIFLDLLSEQGIEVSGVDLDPGMVAQSRRRGHTVVEADVLEHLRAQPAASLAGLFAAHLLEHLPSEAVAEVYREAARILRPGGVFVAVVPNPACLPVLSADFWRDPTHVRFYDPVALCFFAGQAGLSITGSGGNPRNHPGAPAELYPVEGAPAANLNTDLQELLTRARGQLNRAVFAGQTRRNAEQTRHFAEEIDQTMLSLGHLLGTINDRLLTLNHELGSLRSAHRALLDRLYPANEVFVVASRPAES